MKGLFALRREKCLFYVINASWSGRENEGARERA